MQLINVTESFLKNLPILFFIIFFLLFFFALQEMKIESLCDQKTVEVVQLSTEVAL